MTGDEPAGWPPLGPIPRVLLVWPGFPDSFWSFQQMLGMTGHRAVMPPLGLLTVAALCPPGWRLRLVDESVAPLRDSDLAWADLVMVSAMHVQKERVREVLLQARARGRRTLVGGPYASSQPDVLLEMADHVVVGEPDEGFGGIAADLEAGSARRLYRVEQKPDVTRTPVPRFDLLDTRRYASMAIQFSRGCPFECDFCDIITLYGRRPRTKAPQQVIAELDALYELGWRGEVFLVDDNFIGNRQRALDLARALALWQRIRGFPFIFYTEASIDLAQRPELVDAMVEANFSFVFVGIETPSHQALAASKKHQNLREDMLRALHFLLSRGLWVTGGFIVGFDADGEDIFEQQVRFIDEAAIPWAMIGMLQAPPTTPLFDRMLSEGRLHVESPATSNFSLPNFRTKLPLPVLLRGYRDTLARLYEPRAFYDRGFRSLWRWKPRPQLNPRLPVWRKAAIVFRSAWRQGVLAPYRAAYWQFLVRLLRFWLRNPAKLWLGYTVLLSGHHFLGYASAVAAELDRELRRLALER
jgi:radical SAM superfamily enzyme YgiQ (UPF0313 family)